MSVPTDPRNHKPPERIAVKGIRFGERFVEFSRRHGTRIEKVATKNYGASVSSIIRAWEDEMVWLELGTLPVET